MIWEPAFLPLVRSLPAGQAARIVLDVTAFDSGVLRATITGAADAFPFDNSAYTVLQPHRPLRVLLVSPDPGLLERPNSGFNVRPRWKLASVGLAGDAA